MLKKYADVFTGEIANISGWKDSDKAGGCYKNYFNRANNYYVTNYGSHASKSENPNEFFLDLEEPLYPDLTQRFDVVFNHTVLEHVFHVEKAFTNLCQMARDAVILVVPFIQVQHISSDYKDYWRFTPYCIERLFNNNQYTLVVCEYNNHYNAATYLFCIGIRDVELNKYNAFKKCDLATLSAPGRWVGRRLFQQT